MRRLVRTQDPGAAAAQQQLTFAHGDRLTGELVRVQDSNWVFKYQGQKVTIPTADVQTFTAPEPIGIRLTDSTVVVATVRPVADGLKGLTFIWSLLYQYNNPPVSGDERADLTMTYQLGWSTE